MKLSSLLNLKTGNVLAFTGFGGKTAIIDYIAKENVNKKILITPTTKIYPPKMEGAIVKTTLKAIKDHQPLEGIQCFGIKDNTSGKLTKIHTPFLKAIISDYDLVLLEADGSRGLPLKGWGESEPVIPDFVTHTVGVMTLGELGKKIVPEKIFRFSLFQALTGLSSGDIMTLEAYERIIFSAAGLFKNAYGKKILIINQVEEENLKNIIEKWISNMNGKKCFNLMIYGSVEKSQWST